MGLVFAGRKSRQRIPVLPFSYAPIAVTRRWSSKVQPTLLQYSPFSVRTELIRTERRSWPWPGRAKEFKIRAFRWELPFRYGLRKRRAPSRQCRATLTRPASSTSPPTSHQAGRRPTKPGDVPPSRGHPATFDHSPTKPGGIPPSRDARHRAARHAGPSTEPRLNDVRQAGYPPPTNAFTDPGSARPCRTTPRDAGRHALPQISPPERATGGTTRPPPGQPDVRGDEVHRYPRPDDPCSGRAGVLPFRGPGWTTGAARGASSSPSGSARGASSSPSGSARGASSWPSGSVVWHGRASAGTGWPPGSGYGVARTAMSSRVRLPATRVPLCSAADVTKP
jgi:hypothetical protein